MENETETLKLVTRSRHEQKSGVLMLPNVPNMPTPGIHVANCVMVKLKGPKVSTDLCHHA